MEKVFNRATIMGCACVITSGLTVEQIEDFRKYLPEALKLTDEMSGEGVFSIDLDDGPGCITEEKAVFIRTRTPDGKATITVVLDPEIEDKRETVRDKIGASLVALNRLEEQLLGKLDELGETVRRMDNMITQQ